MHHPISGISFLSHFVSLLISLLHIHRTSFTAVYVQYIIIIISALLTPSLFHSRLKTYLFHKSLPL